MDSIIPSTAWQGSAVIEATTGDLLAAASHEYFLDLATKSTPVMDYSYVGFTASQATNELYFPVAHNFMSGPNSFNGWNTYASIQNVGSGNIDVTMQYLNPDGSTAHTVTKTGIAPNVATYFWAKDYTANLGSSYGGSAVVTCSPAASCQMVGMTDDYIQYSATGVLGGVDFFVGLSGGSTTAYFPALHNPSGDTLDSTLTIQNLGTGAADVTVHLVGQDGGEIYQFSDSIAVGASMWYSTYFINQTNSNPNVNTLSNHTFSVGSVWVESTNGQPIGGTGNEYVYPNYQSSDQLTFYNGINR
jgi:hypothetical protein